MTRSAPARTLGQPELAADEEYWVVTSPDGVAYYFGREIEAITGRDLQSAWTVPVFADHPGEPCYNANASLSWCQRVWRWNLDAVVDPNGNYVRILWDEEDNRYARFGAGVNATDYVRGGLPWKIEYGVAQQGTPTSQVWFNSEARCNTLSSCAEPTSASPGWEYPDVPVDLLCGGGFCDDFSPSFFSTRRITSILTESYQPADGVWRRVDEVVLSHEFPANPDGSDPKLWLKNIQLFGWEPRAQGDASAPVPAVWMSGMTHLRNRADSGAGPMWLPRVSEIRNELGGKLQVVYGQTNPCTPIPVGQWATNTKDCFPQWYQPSGGAGGFGAFNKWLVTQIREFDEVARGTTVTTDYTYLDGGAWRHPQDPLVPDSRESYSLWRGYHRVRVQTGGGAIVEHRFYRGMNGNYLQPPVQMMDTAGIWTWDDNWLAGLEREQLVYHGSTAMSSTISEYWVVSSATSQGSGMTARVVVNNKVWSRVSEGGVLGARQTQRRTWFNAEGLALAVIEDGDLFTTADDRCTATEYARNAAAWLLDRPARITVAPGGLTGVACAGTTASQQEFGYDGAGVGGTPTRGNPTLLRTATSPGVWSTVSQQFDGAGRIISVDGPLGSAPNDVTTTNYSPSVGSPQTVTVTNALGHTTTSTMDIARQVVMDTVDPRGLTTTYRYDPVGRVTGVWLPGRSPSSTASIRHSYWLQPGAGGAGHPGWMATDTLQDSAAGDRYLSSLTVVDGFGRSIETQTPSPSGTGRVVTATSYNDRGLVERQTHPFHDGGAYFSSVVTRSGIADVPSETRTSYEPSGRASTVSQFHAGTGLWSTTNSYDGWTTYIDPPKGWTSRTVRTTDAFGRLAATAEWDQGCCLVSIALTGKPDGTITMSGIGSATNGYSRDQQANGGAWIPWTWLGGFGLVDLDVTARSDGRRVWAGVTSDDKIYVNQETSAGGGGTGWIPLPTGAGRAVTVTRGADDRVVLAVVGIDGAVWAIQESSPGGGWGWWTLVDPQGSFRRVDAAMAPDGHVVMVGARTNNELRVIRRTPSGAWTGWASLSGGLGTDITVTAHPDGSLQAYTLASSDATVYTAVAANPAAGWSGWWSFGGAGTTIDAVASNVGDRVAVTAADQTVWTRAQDGNGGGWWGWSNRATTTYSYTVTDQLATIIDNAGNTTAIGYDLAGRRVTLNDPNMGVTSYGYDPAGNLTSTDDARSGAAQVVVRTNYDALFRPTVRYTGDPAATPANNVKLASWRYDATGEAGLLDASSSWYQTAEFITDVTGYTNHNQPAGVTTTIPTVAGLTDGVAGAHHVDYGHDHAGHHTSIGHPAVGGLPAETVTTGYDPYGNPATLTGAAAYVTATTFHGDGHLAGRTLAGDGTPIQRGYSWEPATGRLTGIAATRAGTTIQDDRYTYDPAGNVTSINDVQAGQRQCFSYDNRDRLIRAYSTTNPACGTPTSGGPGPYNHTYGYDALTRQLAGPAGTYSYNAPGHPHAPSTVGATSLNWDAVGNLTTRTTGATTTHTWDPTNRLTTTTGSGATTTNIYDAGGQRLIRRHGTTTTAYLPGTELTSSNGAAPTGQRFYTLGGTTIALRDTTAIHWTLNNHQGSIAATITPAGTVKRQRYGPYGTIRTTDTLPTDHAFLGQPNDPTGLTYLNNRHYDSSTGVFLSVDPIAAPSAPPTLNPYTYARGNPITLADPSGLCAIGWRGICDPDNPANPDSRNYNGGGSRPAGSGSNSGSAGSEGPPASNSIASELNPGAQQTAARSPTGSPVLRNGWFFGCGPVSASTGQPASGCEWMPPSDWDLLGPGLLVFSMLPGTGELIDLHDCAGGDVPCEVVLVPFLSGRGAKAIDEILGGGARASKGFRLGTDDSWGRFGTLDDHFARHGADFGATSADEYAGQASEFLVRGVTENLPTKVDADGTIRIWDPSTNTLGAYNADGTTKSFFKPSSSADYWSRQPGSPPWGG